MTDDKMSPAEHYARAEKLLGGAGGFPHGSPELVTALAEAQVHATLALFPATEPAPYCSKGVCSANEGHDGTCAEASGWAHDAYEDDPARAVPAEEETKAKDEAEICGEFIRLRSRPNICTQPKGHGDDHFNPADLTPFGPVRAGKAYPYADGDHTVLGPEIFTDGYAISWKGEAYVKASTPSSVKELVEAIRFTVEYVGLETLPPIEGWSWYDALLKYAPENAKVFLDAYVPPVNPSPVVPAPTETEWQTWQEVPEGVWFLTNQNIGCWMRRDGDKVTTVTGGWPVCTDSLVAQAPFVAAAEEG